MRLRLPVLPTTLAAAAAAAIALAVGYRALQSPPRPETQPASVAPGASAPSDTSPTLSVYDHPRDLPKIRLSDANRHALTLADFRGKTVLLNVWATWCVPCRKEMPALDRLQAKLGGNGFQVIALSIDRDGVPAVRRFYRDLGLKNLGIYVDPSGAGSQGLAIPGVPASLLIDRDGRELARKLGPAEWDGPELTALIRHTVEGQSAKYGAGEK